MEEFAAKQADSDSGPKYLKMVCRQRRSGHRTRSQEKVLKNRESTFKLSEHLALLPQGTLDCGWFESAESDEGAPFNQNLIRLYETS
ncbi:hypothetical protein GGR58DRAFT_470883 [Xylaria digitata]|nr:hypothetical protein GGR58DRAFT_470883 [Xylaria digitata]